MKTLAFWVLFILVIYAIQSALLYPFAISNNFGDMVMLTVVFLTIIYNEYALFFGFIGGMIIDLASGAFLGLHTFSLILICLGVNYLSQFIHRDSILIPLYSGIFITIINNFIIDFLVYLLGYNQNIVDIFTTLLFSIIYNLILAYPIWYTIHGYKKIVDRFTIKQFK